MVACSKRAHQFDPHCMDDDGDTPLSKARSNGKQPVVDYLEKRLGITPTLTTPPKEDRPSPMRDYSRQETTESVTSNVSVTSSISSTSSNQGAGNKRYRDLLMKSPELDDVFSCMSTLSASWHDIGGRLRVPLGDRQSLLQHASISNDGKLEKILDKWIGSQTSDVTWKMIIGVLIAIEKKNIASEVTRYLDKKQNYDKYIKKEDFVPFDDLDLS